MSKQMKRITIAAAATMSVFVLAVGLYAQNPGGPGGFGRGGPGRGGPGRLGGGPFGPGGPALAGLERVGLSDAQRDQIKTIMQSHQDEMKALAARDMAAHEALNDAITADVIDEGLIRAKSADVAAVQADMAVAHARIRAEALQVLTAEQRAQLKQFQADMKQRMEERRQGRGRGR